MSTITLRNGEEVSIASISTIELGEVVLAELDRSIIAIEEQIERAKLDGEQSEWLIRAKTALKYKRRIRPTLQERLGTIRRANKEQAQLGRQQAELDAKKGWKAAFYEAAKAELTGAQFQAICQAADRRVAGQQESAT